MSEPAHPSSLERVVGRDVSSICFVRDYVQVCFDEFVLTCYTLPTVRMTETDSPLRLGTPAYRDKLCEFIGKFVRSVAEKPDEELAIGFDDGSPVGRSKSPGYGHLKLPHSIIAVSAAEQR